jgi:hypothetical protein
MVTARFRRTGSVLQGTARGECAGFAIRLRVRSTANREAVQRVLHLAHATCYTEACLQSAVPVEVRHELNGSPLEP